MGDARARNVEPDPQHRFLEKLAVFALGDGLRVCADQLHVVLVENAVLGEWDIATDLAVTGSRTLTLSIED